MGLRSVTVCIVLALYAGGVWIFLPPTARIVDKTGIAEPVRGAVHVHTRQSDGSGTLDQVADAAAAAGLGFVILTDHGDGLRSPQPPVYVRGVLLIDAVEVSTTAGHVVALGLPGRTPYRLGGEPRDVVEDVSRLGGFTIVAHPYSAKPDLRWQGWDAAFDGVEWLNADSEWRDERAGMLMRALLTYPFRKAETIASLFDGSADLMQRWDELTARRRVLALAAADAHASIGVGEFENPYGDRSPLAIPGYEQLFRAVSVALPDLSLTGNARDDAAAVLDHIRGGDAYTTVDALASGGALTFTAVAGSHKARPGQTLPSSADVSFVVRADAPAGARIVLLRQGSVVASATGGVLQHVAQAASGAFRVEVLLRDAPGTPPVPWLVSNPIYVGGHYTTGGHANSLHPPAPGTLVTFDGERRRGEWGIEKNDASEAAFDVVPTVGGAEMLWRFALAGQAAGDAYVALALRAPEALAEQRITFSARASRPLRLWVQLRHYAPEGTRDWRRSVYLDETNRAVSIPFADMTPADGQGVIVAPPVGANAILFLVDPTHTPIGTSGQVWIDDVGYGS